MHERLNRPDHKAPLNRSITSSTVQVIYGFWINQRGVNSIHCHAQRIFPISIVSENNFYIQWKLSIYRLMYCLLFAASVKSYRPRKGLKSKHQLRFYRHMRENLYRKLRGYSGLFYCCSEKSYLRPNYKYRLVHAPFCFPHAQQIFDILQR